MASDEIDSGDQPADGDRIIEFVSGDPETFVGLSGHLYRAEVERMTTWRTRLDQTSNWAVVLMAAILTFAFASPDNPHYVLLIGALGVCGFLVIESQRYQEYDAWRYRVRLLQRNLLAGVLDPVESSGDGDWRGRLASNLREPELGFPRWRAFAHRLKRVYFLLLSVLLGAWILRISAFESAESWRQTASIADVPGAVVVGVALTIYLALGVLAARSIAAARVREFSEAPKRED